MKKKAKEPNTDQEFIDALAKIGCEMIDTASLSRANKAVKLLLKLTIILLRFSRRGT